MLVTLIEGYLRAANRHCDKLYRFINQNLTSQPLMKRISFFFFGLSFFYLLFESQIYEAIAAIFWQFASYGLTAKFINSRRQPLKQLLFSRSAFLRLEKEYWFSFGLFIAAKLYRLSETIMRFSWVFLVSSSDALLLFYICSHSKAEKVKFSQ